MLEKIKSEFSFVRGNVLVLIISWVFLHAIYYLEGPFRSLYTLDLGATPLLLGVIGSVGLLILCLSNMIGSYIADRYGRREIIILMTFGYGLSYLFFVFAPCWEFVLIGTILASLCLVYQPALRAITADSIPPEKRGIGYALTEIIPSIPAIGLPLVGGFLRENYGAIIGMRFVYGIAFLCAIIAATIRMCFLKETLDKSERVKLSAIKISFKRSVIEMSKAWRTMPRFLIFLVISFLPITCMYSIWYRFPVVYARDVLGISDSKWGGIITVSIVVTLIVGVLLGKIVDKIGRKKSILIGQAVGSIAIILFLLSYEFCLLLITVSTLAASSLLLTSAYSAFEADLIPREMRGRIMGSINIFNHLLAIPGPVIGGFLYQYIDPRAPFVLCILMIMISTSIVLSLVRETKRREI